MNVCKKIYILDLIKLVSTLMLHQSLLDVRFSTRANFVKISPEKYCRATDGKAVKSSLKGVR
jgi:hypothetical protein